jgi:hypothetical protein
VPARQDADGSVSMSKQWPDWSKEEDTLKKNAKIKLQASDQELFGHLVVDEEHIKKTEQEYENKLNKWYETATQRITKDEDTEWASGTSFNASLTEQERLKRNMHLGDGE